MSTRINRIVFLGTGTSVGVPVIGCGCKVCLSEDPRDNRTRSSLFLEWGDCTILVDSGPDLRMQALRQNITRVDAVLYTHSHLDHVAGFDELRAFCWHKDHPLPLYGGDSCLNTLKIMYPWAFAEDHGHKGYVRPEPRPVRSTFRIGSLEITPLPVEHGQVETFGYLFSSGIQRIAYLPDVKTVPPETATLLGDLDLLIVDALRETPHPTHFSVGDAILLSRQVNPRQTWLTHISHEISHADLSPHLPEGIELAYDGLRINLS